MIKENYLNLLTAKIKFVDDERLKNQNALKNSIKNLYIGNQNKKKTLDEYAQLTTQIREEYAKLQRENNELKFALEKYKNYIEQIQPRARTSYYEKAIRKRKFFKRGYERRYDEEEDESDHSDNYVTEVRKRRKKPRKYLIYDDEIDGEQSEPEIESDVPEEKEGINKPPIIKKKQPKKPKKGIMKSIKM